MGKFRVFCLKCAAWMGFLFGYGGRTGYAGLARVLSAVSLRGSVKFAPLFDVIEDAAVHGKTCVCVGVSKRFAMASLAPLRACGFYVDNDVKNPRDVVVLCDGEVGRYMLVAWPAVQ